MADQKKSEYTIRVECSNCEYGRGYLGESLTVPSGVLALDALKESVCPNCGCKGTLNNKFKNP